MKRKIMATILAVVLVLVLACPGVGACGLSYGKQSGASPMLKTAEKLVADCNRSVERMVRVAQNTPFNDVAALLCSTQALIDTTTAAVRILGFEVECTYTEYVVDGQHVMIDPLRVINPIQGGGGGK